MGEKVQEVVKRFHRFYDLGVFIVHCYVRGMNHNTAAIDVRELVAFDRRKIREVLDAFSEEGAQEAYVLSTCNRTEFYAAGNPPEVLCGIVERALRRFIPQEVVSKPEYWYEHRNGNAVAHLFRVASGMDSMVLGEPEILGQVKDCFDIARAAGSIGVYMNEIYRRCLHIAKRVRTETAIGVGSVSLASSAMDALRLELGSLAERRVILIGTGEMAQQVAQYLAKSSLAAFYIISRTPERAERLAEEYEGLPARMTDLPMLLKECDGVVSATSCPAPIVRRVELVESLSHDRERPLVMVDLAHPRNIEPEVAWLPNIRHYDLDELRTLIDRNLTRRRAELPFAEAIIQREVEQLSMWHRSLSVMDTVKTLRRHFEQVRLEELARLSPRLSESERQATDEATRRILQKLLHTPTVALKNLNPEDPADRGKLALIAALFQLGDDRPNREGDDEETDGRRNPSGIGGN